jgi:hypothetical protein
MMLANITRYTTPAKTPQIFLAKIFPGFGQPGQKSTAGLATGTPNRPESAKSRRNFSWHDSCLMIDMRS